MFRFNLKYFVLMLLLFAAEIIIGAYLHDAFIRPYGGDFLIVIMIYCFVKSFFDTPVGATAFWVLLYAYAVEISQYFHLINTLGLENSKAAQLIMGTSFSWTDMLMYTLGTILVLIIEVNFGKSKLKTGKS